MIFKKTRLYTNFNLLYFFLILKSFFFKKKNFQNKIKDFLGTNNIALTSLGRTALYDIIKLIIEKTKKKTFLIAPYTIPAVLHAIKYAGGTIKFVDIDKKTGLINQDELEKNLDHDSAGVIITHLYSSSQNIKNFINRFNNKILIIEDAAINFGAKIENKYLGTLGDFGFFSFNIVKNLNTLNGGAIFIKDNNLFEHYIKNTKKFFFPISLTLNLLLTVIFIKIFFNNFFYQIFHYFLQYVYKKKITFFLKRIYPILFHEYQNKLPSIYNYDFNWIMNDIGIYNLKKITKNIAERIEKAKLYDEYLDNSLVTKIQCFEGENAMLEYSVILKKVTNKTIHKKLMQNGYDIRHTWYVNNAKDNSNLKEKKYVDSEYLERYVLCLPVHNNINVKDIKRISQLINALH